MTIAQELQNFYTENNFAIDGGESEKTFALKFKFFTLNLPNSQFRKDVIHIHDIQHLLYKCDTTWKRRIFYCWMGNCYWIMETHAYWFYEFMGYGIFFIKLP